MLHAASGKKVIKQTKERDWNLDQFHRFLDTLRQIDLRTKVLSHLSGGKNKAPVK